MPLAGRTSGLGLAGGGLAGGAYSGMRAAGDGRELHGLGRGCRGRCTRYRLSDRRGRKRTGLFEVVTKPGRHRRRSSRSGTVGEQMLYEIGDPQAYILPDVDLRFFADVVLDSGRARPWCGSQRHEGQGGARNLQGLDKPHFSGWLAGRRHPHPLRFFVAHGGRLPRLADALCRC